MECYWCRGYEFSMLVAERGGLYGGSWRLFLVLVGPLGGVYEGAFY